MTPEEKARQRIDAMLVASDWVVQTKDKIVAEVERRLSVAEELETVFADFPPPPAHFA